MDQEQGKWASGSQESQGKRSWGELGKGKGFVWLSLAMLEGKKGFNYEIGPQGPKEKESHSFMAWNWEGPQKVATAKGKGKFREK